MCSKEREEEINPVDGIGSFQEVGEENDQGNEADQEKDINRSQGGENQNIADGQKRGTGNNKDCQEHDEGLLKKCGSCLYLSQEVVNEKYDGIGEEQKLSEGRHQVDGSYDDQAYEVCINQAELPNEIQDKEMIKEADAKEQVHNR